MSNQAKWGIVAALIVIVAIIMIFGIDCDGRPKIKGYTERKAKAYVCEESGEKFGVPLTARVFPPIQHPKTGKRTLVRAHVYIPKGGGEPKALWYSKYSDANIRAMEEYIKNTPPEMIEYMPPDAFLSEQNEGRMIKRPGGRWVTYQQQQRAQGPLPDIKREAETIFEVYPKNWGEILTDEQIEQW